MDENRTTMKPLNGTRTHPLSAHARSVLDRLRREPIPSQEINPGVVNRFHREKLTEVVRLPSPYKSHKGALVDFECITDAGLACIGESTNAKR